MNEINREPLKRIVQETLEQLITDIEKRYAPYWDARTEFVKNIISLASGSIVLTVTFSSSLVPVEMIAGWRYALFASWVFFALSVIFGVVSFWFLTELRAFTIIPIAHLQEVRDAVERIDPESPNPSEPIIDTISKVPAFRADKRSKYFLYVSLVTFILALLLLVSVGWKRFAV